MTSPETQTSATPEWRGPLRPGHAQRAFTLFEVMAAVAILSIWYLILANAAMHSLQAEGKSLRHLEAGLLADLELADLEAGMQDGSVPEVGEESREAGDFIVNVTVGAFSLGSGGLLSAARMQSETRGEPVTGDLGILLQKEIPGFFQYMRTIVIGVTWDEAGRKQHVLRTTFAFDLENAKDMFETESEADEQSSAEEDAESEGKSEE